MQPVDTNGVPLPNAPPTTPTLENYNNLAISWSLKELNHYLKCTKALGNSRIPPHVLDEARSIDEEHITRLKVLSIAGGVSYDTLKYGLLSEDLLKFSL